MYVCMYVCLYVYIYILMQSEISLSHTALSAMNIYICPHPAIYAIHLLFNRPAHILRHTTAVYTYTCYIFVLVLLYTLYMSSYYVRNRFIFFFLRTP